MSFILNTKKGKKALDDAIMAMKRDKVNQIEFSPIGKGILILVKDNTEEAQKKLKENLILDFIEQDGVKYLICRE